MPVIAAALFLLAPLGAALGVALAAPSHPLTPAAGLDPAKVTGPDACAECHKQEATIWQHTHHFATFTTMPRSKKAREIANRLNISRIKNDSACLDCHFTSRAHGRKRRPIAGISCESCHGAGRDWIKVHSAFSGRTEATETKRQEAARWKQAEALGMIRPSNIYALAKNCYGCHVVPQEKLVNTGGHRAGSDFNLVAWSQGEVRHNVWYTKAKSNPAASPERARMLYVVGLGVELETALHGLARATARKIYAFAMAKRVDDARNALERAAKAVPGVTELAKIVGLAHSAALRLDNAAALDVAADAIAAATRQFAAGHDGRRLGALDPLIPGPAQFKGTASN